MTQNNNNDKTMMAMKMFVREEFKKTKHNYPECMVKEVAEGLLKAQGRRAAMMTEDDRVLIYDPDSGEVLVMSKNPNYTNPKHNTIHIKEENDRLYKEIKDFDKIHTEEDILYNHNVFDQYMVLKIDEMIDELHSMNKRLGGKRMRLNDCDIRTTKINGKKYYRITFHHENSETPSRVEAVFGHMVYGFTYIFKEQAFKQNKERILACVEHKQTEFGKNTRWDICGNVYDKKKGNKKGKKGKKVARKKKTVEDA